MLGREVVRGKTYYTVTHPQTAQVWRRCLPLSIGGGGDAAFMQIPLEVPEKGEIVEALLVFDAYGATYLLGATGRDQVSNLLEESPAVAIGAAHPKTFGPGDYVISNGRGENRARVIVSNDGSVTIAAASSIRLQVGQGGQVLVVDEGLSSMPVVVYDPLKDYLDEVMTRVNANTAQIARLTPVATAYHAGLAEVAAGKAAIAAAPPVSNAVLAAQHTAEAIEETAKSAALQPYLADASPLDPVGSDIGSVTMSAPYKEPA